MLCVRVFLLVSLSVAGLCSLQDLQTDFGLRVFSRMVDTGVASQGGNLAFSPYGVASVLGMVQLGARGNTRKALSSAMGFSLQGEPPVAETCQYMPLLYLLRSPFDSCIYV